MTVKIEKQDKNMVKLDIEIDTDTAMKEYSKSCKRLAQRVNIPGFRKGKAPRNVIEKFVGIEAIQRDALDYMLPAIFAQAIRDNNLNVITEPYLESYKFEPGKPVEVVAKMELKPEVKIEQYKGLEVDVEEYKTADEALDKELKSLAERYATLEPVINRETTGKDIVLIDFEGSANGEPIKGGASKNYMLDLGNSNFIPGFAEQLVGKKIGEEFTIDVKFPDEYHDEKLKGQPAQFKIKINEIKEKNVPEINDELAKKVGPFKTIEDLKADIQKYLDNTANSENEKRKSGKIFETVLEKLTVDVQDSMINREAQVLLDEFKQKVKSSGVEWDKVVEQEGHEKIWDELRKEALNRIKNSLLISEIAKLENIQVTSADIEQKLNELSAVYGMDRNMILKEIQKNTNLIQSLSQQALSQKVTKFLLDNNKFNFVKSEK